MKTEKRAKEARHRSSDESSSTTKEAKKKPDYAIPTPPPDRPPPLLRESRTTAAALTCLEKGIKFIYQKDLKRARQELKSLLQDYPGEPEILARARTYLQICDREENAARKPVVSNDQLYSLGVLNHNRGDYDGAIAYFRQSLENHPEAEYIYYSLAASLSMKGDPAGAIHNLRRAIEVNEDNRVYAKNDSDFAPLYSNKEFVDLVGLPQPASNGAAQR